MKFYRKTSIQSIVCIICITAAVGLFQKEAAAQLVADDFERPSTVATGWDSSSADWSQITNNAGTGGSGDDAIQLNKSNTSDQRTMDATATAGLSNATLTLWYQIDTGFGNLEVRCGATPLSSTLLATLTPVATYTQSSEIDVSSCTSGSDLIFFGPTAGSASGNPTASIDDVQITVASLLLTISPSSITEGETATGTVTRNTNIGVSSLVVTLTIVEYDGDGVADVTLSSTSITIGINDASATFTISTAGVLQNDTIMEPTETITITASEAGGLTDSDDVTVLDNDYAGPYSGDSIGFPTFFLTASYDWLHDFYDDNEEGLYSSSGVKYTAAQKDNMKTDPDTDNFNKIIMIDSNLFPIYTALQGDIEWPNIIMRNWTSGPGTGSPTSPSVNDYMNRTLAVVPNYINATTKLSIGYGTKDKLTALGMRSHLEWAYVVDPANANFRRYKFVKINDVVVPEWYEGGISGDITDLTPGGGDADVSDCENCCPNSWYQGDSVDILCGSGAGKDTQCCDGGGGAKCFSDDTQLLFLTKFPKCGAGACPDGAYPVDPNTDCNGVPNYPACEKDASAYQKYLGTTGQLDAPYVRFPVLVNKSDASAGTFATVRFTIVAHAHDSSAGAVFILNRGNVSACEKLGVLGENPANSFPPGPIDWEITGSSSCADCEQEIDIDFTNVPDYCMEDYDDEQGLMYVDIIPCHHAGIVIEVPPLPIPKDNAFQVSVGGYSNITGGELDSYTAAQIQDMIDKRWANISGYMDIVPPESYPGYPSYTAAPRTIGYGYTTNTSFTSADYIRFRNPRDIDTYRDYFDYDNAGPVYIFVADTMNSRIQVFMNATGSAGDVNAAFPIRPVRVAKRTGIWSDSSLTEFGSNELAMRVHTGINNTAVAFGDGREADWRNYTTVSGVGSGTGNRTLDNQSRIPAGAGRGEFYYPHGVAVDQDPDTKDVYLFVADTFNHRIQIFRDTTGVTNQSITDKRFDFQYEEGWGTYPLQTSNNPDFVAPPGPFHFRYPKGVDVVRFANNSSYLYVVDSKNYRLMKYLISEGTASQGITAVEAVNAYGYDGTNFSAGLFSQQGTPMMASSTNPGFLNPQDVATGYSGFYIHTSSAGKGIQFLNNNMVYVSDYARNNTSISRDYLNMRVQQFIQVPTFTNLSGSWIPWDTEAVEFGSWTSNNLALGQSVYGLSDGFYNSSSLIAGNIVEGSTENVPGKPGYFTDRPVGLAALQWNTQKPIDIRVLSPADIPTTPYVAGSTLPRGTEVRIGVSSRYLFKPPENSGAAFLNSSTEWSERTGRWDGLYTGRVHVFCYDKFGQFDNHTALHTAPYRIQLSTMGCQANGFAKIVAEDKDFAYSARTGTMFFRVGN